MSVKLEFANDFGAAWLEERCAEFSRRLAELGVAVASIGFTNAPYDGVNDAAVTLEAVDGGYKVTAFGQAVAFIEFGAGVHFNGSGMYPAEVPPEISPIGTYGRGNGSKDYWFYRGEPGTAGGEASTVLDGFTITHGNPASMPMYNSQKAIMEMVADIALEVFST